MELSGENKRHFWIPEGFAHGFLVTSDVAAAAEFYGKVFGWTFETYGGEDDRDTYTLVLSDGLPIGGMVIDQRAKKGDVPSARWIGLVSVPDVKAAAAAVSANGGKVLVAPKSLGERGETAVFQDPEGVPFGESKGKNSRPKRIDSCHALSSDGDVVKKRWPEFYTGPKT